MVRKKFLLVGFNCNGKENYLEIVGISFIKDINGFDDEDIKTIKGLLVGKKICFGGSLNPPTLRRIA